MKVWSEVGADSSGDFLFAQGERYAVLASVSKNYSLDEVRQYLGKKGFTVTYAWEQGTPTRGQFPIDDWLARQPPDPTDNHRWIYGEADLDPKASPWTVGKDAPWPLTVYSIAHVFHAVEAPAPTSTSPPQDAPAPALPPPKSSCPAPGRSTGFVVLVSAASVAGGYLIGRYAGPALTMWRPGLF